jgi:hypothetical protein
MNNEICFEIILPKLKEVAIVKNEESKKVVDMEWRAYVTDLIGHINKNKDAVVLGVSGSKESRKELLRVYMNGGCVLQIPLVKSKKFIFPKTYFYDDKKDKSKKQYLSKSETDRIICIMHVIEKNPYAWKNETYSLLNEFLGYMGNATREKFENTKSGVVMERKYQTMLYKKMIMEKDRKTSLAIVDVEFRTTEKMNWEQEEIEENRRRNKVNKKNSRLHCSKPDFVAATEDGFMLIELKTNSSACEGNAGLDDHNKDFDKLIKFNDKNHYLVEELKERLKYAYQYGLYNTKFKTIIEKLLNKDIEKIKLIDKYLFIPTVQFPKEKIVVIIRKHGIDNKSLVESM